MKDCCRLSFHSKIFSLVGIVVTVAYMLSVIF